MDQVKIICKCIPGFEKISLNECQEKLGVDGGGIDVRGRIFFNMNICDIADLQELRSVTHYWVIVSENENYFGSFENNDELFASLVQLPEQLCWKKALRTWKEFKMKYKPQPKITNGVKEDAVVDNEEAEDKKVEIVDEVRPPIDLTDIDPLTAGEELSFRVTGVRTGKHKFSSMEIARHLGTGVNETFFWKVDMTKFDIEVVLYALDNKLTIGIQLTTVDQASRNIMHFGPTTLRANICYCLLHFVRVDPGDIVCDPMCGSAAISIEGTLSCPAAFHLAGENHPIAMEHSSDNLEAIEKENRELFSLPASVVRWDVYQLPLRTASVDKIITDLPFGKRMGNKERNMFLYPVALREMARICRPRSGRAALLTQHKGALARAVKNCCYWRSIEVRKMLMGGLDVVVYLLERTKEVFPENTIVLDTALSDKPAADQKIKQGVEMLTIS